MKIIRMHKADFGKIRAFFDLLTGDGFTIKGFKIIEGINGLFVSMPSEKTKDDKYQDTVYCSKEIRENLNSLAIEYFNNPHDHQMREAMNNSSTEKVANDDEIIPF